MAQCKDCIHNGLCKIYSDFIRNHDCELFVGKADVVPKSEVERLNAVMKDMDEQRAYTINMLTESLEKAKQEVAREIFEEIEKVFTVKYPMCTNPVLVLDSLPYTELKKKYTESEGNP